MQYINSETGEIVTLVPYKSMSRSVRRTRRSRRMEGLWQKAFRELFPLLLGLTLVWSLLTIAR